MAKKTPKKRNPQDATLRNIRALEANLQNLRVWLAAVRMMK